MTRDEAAIEMAAHLRARATQGETLLLGMKARFALSKIRSPCDSVSSPEAKWMEAEYVGGEEDFEQGYYTFRFGSGATVTTERMHLALMEPDQWCVATCVGASACDGTMEGIPPSR